MSVTEESKMAYMRTPSTQETSNLKSPVFILRIVESHNSKDKSSMWCFFMHSIKRKTYNFERVQF